MVNSKLTLDGDAALLPTIGKPGTYEWCEEVMECMTAAWRTREAAEQGFLAAVRAAVRYRIWETLSPPPPHQPYRSLEGLIRAQADEGQAENMHIAIRFSGVLDELAVGAEGGRMEFVRSAAVTRAPGGPEMHMSLADGPIDPEQWLDEDAELAAGRALLDQYDAATSEGVESLSEAESQSAVGLPTPHSAATPRPTPASRKRERLEREHPELLDAVQTGAMSIKQAYVAAGIEKPVPTLDKLQRLWRTASEEERDRFMEWLDRHDA